MGAQRRAVLGNTVSPAELQALIASERRGSPFLFLRGGDGTQQILPLDQDRLVIGRSPGSDLEIGWDGRVSGVHAYMERRGRRWVIEDDGLSRNGTFVDGERLHGQRTLGDGDTIRVGATVLGFRDPRGAQFVATATSLDFRVPEVSEAQHRVLVALCRPLADDGTLLPAGNEAIAEELVLSIAAVKSHLRLLFERFGVSNLPQNEKRVRLAERALKLGVVQARHLGPASR